VQGRFLGHPVSISFVQIYYHHIVLVLMRAHRLPGDYQFTSHVDWETLDR
jgi:hypothetical protein